MSKVRVYELAKEYGLKGPDLAKMLKDMGFEAVKSHMAVLDDATELHVRAVIEAQGHKVQASGGETAVEAAVEAEAPSGGLRKKALPGIGGAAAADSGLKSLPNPADRKRLPEPKRDAPKPLRRIQDEDASPAPRPETPPLVSTPEPAADLPERIVKPAVDPAPAAGNEAPRSVAPAARRSEPAPVEEAPTTPRSKDEPAPAPALGQAGAAQARPPKARQDDTGQVAEPPKPPAAANPPASSVAATPTTVAEPPMSAATTADQAATTPVAGPVPTSDDPKAIGPDAAPNDSVKRLLVPEARAKVLGRIELTPEAIRDAQRRSAPPSARNPGGVDRDLRRAALRSTQSRTAAPRGRPGQAPQRRGPATGPGQAGRGRTTGRTGRKGGGLASSVDPNKVVEIQPPITIKALSEALGVKVNDLIATLTFKLGVLGKTINSFLTNDEVELVALEVNRKIKIVERQEAEAELLAELQEAHDETDADQEPRAPVVTFMGHVDHGKTSLLDALRRSDVAKGEAGGITQHIGAYKVTWKDGSEFVVLDTPGHEAFTQMRARGAKLTDIVVLVVAADDGVMPQTEEAIAHASDAGVKVIVAINKCDRPDARPLQVKQQLAVKGLQPEEWGGTVGMIEVSATTGAGLDELVERIALEAEMLELFAKSDAAGEAVVVESRQSPEQGVVVNVLVMNGTLRVRDNVLCGDSLSRIRGLIDDHGRQIKEAGPATPVSLLGLTSLPQPGDRLYVITDVKKAKEVAEERSRTARTLSLAERSKMTAENLRAQLESRNIEEIKLILKADVMGSLEPIRQSLAKLNTEEVRVNVIHAALGGITETDVSLAEASGAMVIGFNMVADTSARQAAERAGVQIRFYDVIYGLIDDIKLAMEGKLRPEEVEEVIGHAEIRAVFRSSKFGNIAGCFVLDGIARRNADVRLTRDGRVIYTGKLDSLRREKDDAKEVRAGFECGMVLANFNDIKEGDQLEFFSVKLVKRTLD
ncbi:MAG: translation initiation factor IF-2 [Planctomycetota bacterium]